MSEGEGVTVKLKKGPMEERIDMCKETESCVFCALKNTDKSKFAKKILLVLFLIILVSMYSFF